MTYTPEFKRTVLKQARLELNKRGLTLMGASAADYKWALAAAMVTLEAQGVAVPVVAAIDRPIGFDIIDSKTGGKVGHAKTRAGATRSCDKRDNAYGAYRYLARAVYAT